MCIQPSHSNQQYMLPVRLFHWLP